jgi:phosphatidate cytidylyltransferase
MLKTRIITAIVSLLVLCVVLFVVPPVVARQVIASLVLVGAWEWSGFLGVTGTSLRVAYVVLIGALMTLAVIVYPQHAEVFLQIACVWWCIAFFWTFLFPTPIPVTLRWLCGVLVLVPLFVALIELYSLQPELLVIALLIVWAADIGAYFAGKRFGSVKLAPSISPGKTWEGVFGGLTMVLLLTLIWAYFRQLPLAVLLPFCLAVAVLSIVGDLTVSMFKRTAGVKDSGKLFPGHGGVLDRIDSVAAAAPLFALGLVWLDLV